MNPINNFSGLTTALNALNIHKHIVAICASDPHTQYAVQRAVREGFASFTLIGNKDFLKPYEAELNLIKDKIEIIDIKSADEAAWAAVRMIRAGKADVLMKGIINTDNLLHIILDRKEGLMLHDHVLSHVAVVKIPTYNKMLFVSDAAVIPKPSYSQFIAEINYAIGICSRFGIDKPRISLLHCVEKVNSKFPYTMDYKELIAKANRGEFGDVIMDGPLDLSISCSKEAANIKRVESPINGEADILIFPNIESGNIFYKSVALFAKAEMAGTLQGTACPVIVTSRGDSKETKYYSLAMACLTSQKYEINN